MSVGRRRAGRAYLGQFRAAPVSSTGGLDHRVREIGRSWAMNEEVVLRRKVKSDIYKNSVRNSCVQMCAGASLVLSIRLVVIRVGAHRSLSLVELSYFTNISARLSTVILPRNKKLLCKGALATSRTQLVREYKIQHCSNNKAPRKCGTK